MHDTLRYLADDPIHRRYHHGELTFRGLYAFTENFVLPLSHDEVVHGKGSLLAKMPGDDWQQLANLRLLYGYQYGQPGKKLLFMGGEFGQRQEWDHDAALDWDLLDDPAHAGRAAAGWPTSTRSTGASRPCTSSTPTRPASSGCRLTRPRSACSASCAGRRNGDPVLVVCNFTPVPRPEPAGGRARRAGTGGSCSTATPPTYGGAASGNLGGVEAQPVPWHGRPRALNLVAPPLGCLFLGARRSP